MDVAQEVRMMVAHDVYTTSHRINVDATLSQRCEPAGTRHLNRQTVFH